jgi:hypothetical protein
MMRLASCHSDPAVAGEESQFISGECVGRALHFVRAAVRAPKRRAPTDWGPPYRYAPRKNSQRCFAKPFLSGVEGLNMTIGYAVRFFS